MCLHSPIMNSNDCPCAFCAVVPSLFYTCIKRKLRSYCVQSARKKTNCDMKEISKKRQQTIIESEKIWAFFFHPITNQLRYQNIEHSHTSFENFLFTQQFLCVNRIRLKRRFFVLVSTFCPCQSKHAARRWLNISKSNLRQIVFFLLFLSFKLLQAYPNLSCKTIYQD